jgi:hypothetical protein
MATATSTPSTERLSSYNPATRDLIGTVPIHGAVEVDAAVARARVAADSWGALSFEARGERERSARRPPRTPTSSGAAAPRERKPGSRRWSRS